MKAPFSRCLRTLFWLSAPLIALLLAAVIFGRRPAQAPIQEKPLSQAPSVGEASAIPSDPVQVVLPPPEQKLTPPKHKKALIEWGDVLREEQGSVRYLGNRFGALFAQGSMQFTAMDATKHEAPTFIRFRLEDVRVGDTVLSAGGDALPHTRPEKRTVYYDRGAVEEQYILTRESCEQTFIVRHLPPERGAITVKGRLETNAKPPTESSRGDSLAFRRGDREAFEISKAVAFDAKGKRIALELAYAEGRMTITLPAQWVQSAELPILIDPTYLATHPTGYQYYYEQPYVFPNVSDGGFTIFWSSWDGGTFPDFDLLMQRFDSNGNPIGSHITLDDSPGYKVSAGAANTGAPLNRTLLTWGDGSMLRGLLLDSTGFPLGNAFDIGSMPGIPAMAYGSSGWYLCAGSTGLFLDDQGQVTAQVDPDTDGPSANVSTVVFAGGAYRIAYSTANEVYVRTLTGPGNMTPPVKRADIASGSTNISLTGGPSSYLLAWDNGYRLLDASLEPLSEISAFKGPKPLFGMSCVVHSSQVNNWYVVGSSEYIKAIEDSSSGGPVPAGVRVNQQAERFLTDILFVEDPVSSSTTLSYQPGVPKAAYNATSNRALVVYGETGQVPETYYQGRLTAWIVDFPTSLAAPSLTATGASDRVDLQWPAVAGATGYYVHRYLFDAPTLAEFVTTNSYTDSTSQGYSNYWVRAVGLGMSPVSNMDVASYYSGPAPSPPSAVSASPSSEQITLQWTLGPGAVGVHIRRAVIAGGSYDFLDGASGSSTYVDKGLVNGRTYYYLIRSVGQGGVSSDVGFSAIAGGAPSAPAGLTATPGISQITLQWSTLGTGVTYTVKRSTFSGGPYTTIISGHPATNFTDTGLTNGMTYYYVVSGTNIQGEGANCAEVFATPPLPPSAPIAVAATLGDTQATITWAPVAGATSYKVRRSNIAGGPYSDVATNLTVISFVNTGLTNGSPYFYVVCATNAAGDSPNSSEVQAVPLSVPSSPANLVATAKSGQALLTWTASGGATSYTVRRGTINGGPYVNLATVTSASYLDTALTNGSVYYYVVVASNASGTSVASNQASAAPVAAPTGPLGFTSLTPQNGSVSLSWAPAAGATSYVIRRATVVAGPYVVVTSTATASPYLDIGLTNGTTHYYTIAGRNAGGDSAPSAPHQVTPLGPPGVPQPYLTIPSNNTVILYWNPGEGATSYNIKRSTSSGGPYTTIFTGQNGGSYTDTGLTNGQTYYYVVSGVNYNGESANSTQISGRPYALPGMPDLFSATPYDGAVRLSWTTVSTPPGASGMWYNVKRSSTSGGPYSTIASLVSGTTYTDFTAVNNLTYYYVVSASDPQEGQNSNQRSATPLSTLTVAAPTGLYSFVGNNSVALGWQAVTGAATYIVKRGSATLASGLTGLNYTDATAVNGTTYSYTVTAVKSGGQQGPASQPHTVIPVGPPAAPTLSSAVASSSYVTLTWTSVPQPTGYTRYYRVRRATAAGGPYTTVAQTLSTTTYVDAGLTNGTTYYYVVTAYVPLPSGWYTESLFSNERSSTPQSTLKPPTPANFTAGSGDARVFLSWNASPGAATYTIRRGSNGGPYTTIVQSGVTATTHTATGLANGTTYYFVVSAVNGGGESANSTQASARPLLIPTGLSATAGSGQVQLNWSATSGASSYRVYRATSSGGPYSLAASPTTNSYLHLGLVNSTTYYFTVSAVIGGFESGKSTQVSATPNAAPPSPADLTASAGYRQVALAWSASATASSYTVKRSTQTGGPYSVILTGLTSTAFTDSNLTSNVTYCYVVSAVNSHGESQNSTEASAMPMIPAPSITTTPGKKTNDRHPLITGTAVANAIVRVYFNGIWDGFNTAANGVGDWAYHNPARSNSDATYEVTAVAILDGDSSPPSSPVNIIIDTFCAPPDNVTATPRNQAIDIEWSPSPDSDVIGYRVYRSTSSPGGPYDLLNTTQLISGTRYRDGVPPAAPLVNGQQYWYRVTAVDDTLNEAHGP